MILDHSLHYVHSKYNKQLKIVNLYFVTLFWFVTLHDHDLRKSDLRRELVTKVSSLVNRNLSTNR